MVVVVSGAKSKYIMLQLGRRLSMGKPSSYPGFPHKCPGLVGPVLTSKYNLGATAKSACVVASPSQAVRLGHVRRCVLTKSCY